MVKLVTCSLRLAMTAILVANTYAYTLAQRVDQSVARRGQGKRAEYLGGWALQADVCPATMPVICKGAYSNSCCPAGQTCFSSGTSYCCPTAADCQNVAKTLPVCADPTMNMYITMGLYFCCPNGQIGVLPYTGFGICLPGDQNVPVSQLATMVHQNGGTSVTPFGGYASATTVPSVTGSSRGATATSAGSPGGSNNNGSQPAASPGSSSAPANPSSSSSPSSNTPVIALTTGTIVGIAVGAGVGAIILIYLAWTCGRRGRKVEPYYPPPPPVANQYQPPEPQRRVPAFQPSSPAPPYDPIHRRVASPTFSPVSPLGSPPQQYSKIASNADVNVTQLDGNSRYEVNGVHDGRVGRAEM